MWQCIHAMHATLHRSNTYLQAEVSYHGLPLQRYRLPERLYTGELRELRAECAWRMSEWAPAS